MKNKNQKNQKFSFLIQKRNTLSSIALQQSLQKDDCSFLLIEISTHSESPLTGRGNRYGIGMGNGDGIDCGMERQFQVSAIMILKNNRRKSKNIFYHTNEFYF